MAEDKQTSAEHNEQKIASVGGEGASPVRDEIVGTNSDKSDSISKSDRWKSYLDTRKQYVDCEFKTSQDFDKIMLTWPAALIAGSLTIFWHIDGTVFWMEYLYIGWFFEFTALALMLGSMVTRQLLYRHLIARHDENYQEYLNSEVNVSPENPWKMKTQLVQWFSIVALLIGAVFIFAFSISNAPSSSSPINPSTKTKSPTASSSGPTRSMLTQPPIEP